MHFGSSGAGLSRASSLFTACRSASCAFTRRMAITAWLASSALSRTRRENALPHPPGAETGLSGYLTPDPYFLTKYCAFAKYCAAVLVHPDGPSNSR